MVVIICIFAEKGARLSYHADNYYGREYARVVVDLVVHVHFELIRYSPNPGQQSKIRDLVDTTLIELATWYVSAGSKAD
jgi:hypothetical protein